MVTKPIRVELFSTLKKVQVQTSLSKRQFLKEKSFINNLGEGAGVTLITFDLDLKSMLSAEHSQEGAILPPSSQARLNI